MRGLILCGGSGTRLRPLTHTGAKQLVPVANRPILFYVLDNLVEAGIVDIGIVVSPETGQEVAATIGNGGSWGAKFTFIEQNRPAGLAHAVTTAKDFLGDEDFCMFLGDNLIGTKIKPFVDTFNMNLDIESSIMLKEVGDPSSFGVAEVAGETVVSLVEKPKEPKSNLALVGIYLFRKSIHHAISQIKPSARGELEITDAISKLLELGHKVNFNKIESWWLDTGKKDDLLLANDIVLDDWAKREIIGQVDQKSSVTGRVAIGAGSQIIGSSIRGPVVIGNNAVIIDSKIGPFTSVGNGVKIESSCVEHSVILNDSKIININRLEDSLIGKRVTVGPGTGTTNSLSLLVGDDSKIELSKSK